MSTEFNERLPEPHDERAQIWIVGTREQVNHIISEMYVRQMVSDRSQFSPLMPAPFANGRYMTLLLR
ncbi:MAG: hypothetical protein KME07_01770 [Pegethrix bostrychoides GSE-TBD4-15B]|jgi:hypothetical protein|uniref:Uncharacterized protein n=1 Tax=Pegethrix bostrychoides GSE-TBD4-15B TaxID=2839662 RepID=A0A951P723_9CYAN|nr:hypothetical protein [Pegethrix bostrychoides GSE-TBD4-15B]